jgi:small subunit ribosomal protein S4
MIKYLGPKVKLLRKFGFLPGLTNKKINKRKKTPGQHGKIFFKKRKQLSLSDDFKEKLVEKQKLRFNYGLCEKQMLRYYYESKKSKESTGKRLLELIESRLDCIVYRLGFSLTIPEARQLINHGHILVNNKKVNIASFHCKPSDIITFASKCLQRKLKKTSENSKNITNLTTDQLTKVNFTNYLFSQKIPSHLKLTLNPWEGIVLSNVKLNSILLNINELKIVEYYSR